MTSYVFSNIKKLLATSNFNFTSGVFKMALMSKDVLNESNYDATTWSQIKQYEISGLSEYNHEGYQQAKLVDVKSQKITMRGSGEDTVPDYRIYANNITYPVSTIDADCAVIVKSISGGYGDIVNDDIPVLVLDLRPSGVMKSVSSSQGVFTIKLDNNSGGYLIIK
jgi:hypothetical protein